MAPKPVRSFRQTQPITTTLKNICESYPAETCPRELLQNADDAGATEIEFVLVTKTYPIDKLLHEQLREYQGPALLVRNNSVFLENDFENLARVGDSFKRHDASVTGKFGRGFNSVSWISNYTLCANDEVKVYHWTDGPQILSQDTFLILDPHQHWSIDVGQPGGPAYKVDSSPEIENHLRTFDIFDLDLSKGIAQTFIRIPLRTNQQAKRSEIVRREVKADEIIEALEGFAQELREGGLLFLKHVKKVTIRLDERIFAQSKASEGGLTSSQSREDLPARFLRLYGTSVPRSQQEVVKVAFQLNIEHFLDSSLTTNRYIVQHIMRSSTGDEQLDAWAKEEKLFPWVAIAAPLISDSSTEPFRGRLFSTLQLPISTNHPVHIHGLWSITPDRRCLVSAGRTSKKDDLAVTWNKYMFTKCVPEAWSSVLANIDVQSWHEKPANLWPRINDFPTEIWDTLDQAVIDDTIERNLMVWKSSNGRLTISDGFFAEALEIHEKYISALEEVQMPVIHLARPLLSLLKARLDLVGRSLHILSPTSARAFLRSRDLSSCSQEVLSMLLEYSLSDALSSKSVGVARAALYKDLHSIRFWPTSDGSFVAIATSEIFLPRNQDEVHLFKEAREAQTINIDNLPAAILTVLRQDIAHVSSVANIRYRQLADLAIDWDVLYPTNGASNMQHFVTRPGDERSESNLRNAWKWIATRYQEEKRIPTLLDGLYLLPTNGRRLRRLTPTSVDMPFLVSLKASPVHTTLEELIRDSDGIPPMLDISVFSVQTAKIIGKVMKGDLRFQSAHIEDLDSFTAWLYVGRSLLTAASDTQIDVILEHIHTLITIQRGTIELTKKAIIAKHVRALPIFSLITASGKKYATVKSSLNMNHHVVEAPQDLPLVHGIPNISFFDLSNRTEKFIVTSFGLIETLSLEELMKDHLLPWAVCATDEQLTQSKREVIDYIFTNSQWPSQAWVAIISEQPIIPLSSADGQSPRYGCLSTLIDPSSFVLGKLYFEDEDVFPERRFFETHRLTLSACGLKHQPIWDLPLHRARHYATCNADPRAIVGKFKSLTELPVQNDLSMSQPATNEIQALSWVPATTPNGELTLKSPKDCRDHRDRLLVDYVLSIPTSSVRNEWRKLLGWNKPINISTLFQQLDFSLAQKERSKVGAVLRYLFDTYKPAQYIDSLCTKPCVLGSHGMFLLPQRVFFPGRLLATFPMAPYLDKVDDQFRRDHSNLMTVLQVRNEPSCNDLLAIQRHIIASNPGSLEEDNLKVVISLLEIATSLPDPDRLAHIKVPNTEAVLRSLSEVVHGDQYANNIPNFTYIHSSISPALIKRLEIDDCRERAIQLEVRIPDEDDDEYTPREQLATIISDALGRYSIRSTFNEFLANAEDCYATKISWTLDPCSRGHHGSGRTFSKELRALQGPALFVHNDSVFSEKDFAGFKEIGRGGKGDEVTSTGMFGRGALSLYHFTDVPMLISGKSLLIIDPQQQLLSRNKLWKRKVGVRLSLKNVKESCPDQLAPFHGLFGFKDGTESYDGTIFRLPFRESPQTNLKEIPEVVNFSTTEKLLEEYYEDARMALLFLRNVELIEFTVRGEANTRWSVSAERLRAFEEDIFWRLTLNTIHNVSGPRQDTWWIGIEDLQERPTGIENPGRGAQKITECGVAACLSHSKARHNIFCKLPMPELSHLPISIHASFAITADRQTIPFKDTYEDLEMNRWNRWLLTQCIPKLYIEMLKEMTPKLGQQTFEYWPHLDIVEPKADIARLIAKAFWVKLSDPQYASYALYPTINVRAPKSSETALVRRPGGAKILHPATNFECARFDFLPEEDSQVLRPLHSDAFPSLVRPPLNIWTELQSQQPTIVEHRSLCDWLRNGSNNDRLTSHHLRNLNEQTKVKTLEVLLRFLLEGAARDDLAILYGCRIIPLVDGKLGILQQATDLQKETYYTITESERSVFAFASRFLVDNHVFPAVEYTMNPFNTLITSSLFNLQPLTAWDVGKLVASSVLTIPLTGRDAWTISFWQYLNQKVSGAAQSHLSGSLPTSTETLLSKCGLKECPVYRSWTGEHWKYLTPTQFDTEAYVVEPSGVVHQTLCRGIDGLELVDKDCIPYTLRESETSLELYPSFMRVLRALSKISENTKEPLCEVLNRELNVISLGTLRILFLNHVSAQNVTPQYRSVLQSLPIWRRFECAENASLPPYIAAQGAIFCLSRKLLVPWLSDRQSFVDPLDVNKYRTIVQSLGSKIANVADIWKLLQPALPGAIKDFDTKLYYDFISVLKDERFTPTASTIVPDGDGKLLTADSLYDHEEGIFKAAFRNSERSNFVHPDFRSLRQYWIDLGIKVRAASRQMSWQDYSACVSAIDRRQKGAFQDPALFGDAGIVSAYLEWDHPSLREWPQHLWTQICSVRMFHVQSESSEQLAYRRSRMRELAVERPLRSVQEVAEEKYRAIVWSQSTFLARPPAPYLFTKLLNGGSPSVFQVVKHIKYLISICSQVHRSEFPRFLKDIKDSYSYMQDNPSSTKVIPNIKDEAIWLNVDTTEVEIITVMEFRSALVPAKLLCLNSPVDPEPIKVARRFLVPYEMLLKELGCPIVVERKIQVPNDFRDTADPFAVVMANMLQLRDQGQLVDVVFKVEGQTKAAHKICLAAVSEYCKTQFSGEWGKMAEGGATIEMEDMPFKTLSRMIDFAYTGGVEWPQLKDLSDRNQIADNMDELLDLLDGANRWFMLRLHTMTEKFILTNYATYVRVDNVKAVLARATDARAKQLVEECNTSIQDNANFLHILENS